MITKCVSCSATISRTYARAHNGQCKTCVNLNIQIGQLCDLSNLNLTELARLYVHLTARIAEAGIANAGLHEWLEAVEWEQREEPVLRCATLAREEWTPA